MHPHDWALFSCIVHEQLSIIIDTILHTKRACVAIENQTIPVNPNTIVFIRHPFWQMLFLRALPFVLAASISSLASCKRAFFGTG